MLQRFSSVRIDGGHTQPLLAFEDSDARYHVWLEPDTLEPQVGRFGRRTGAVIVHKNMKAERQPSHLNHRSLNGNSARWAAIIGSMLGTFDLSAEKERIAGERTASEIAHRQEQEERRRQVEAGARLSDAAPDLLAALRRLANEVRGCLPLIELQARQDMGNTNYSLLMQRAEEALAAIAKVEGR